MSLKSIELQIAIPRTHDAGKLQEQFNQRGQLIHDQLADTIKKEDDIKKTQVPENNDSEKIKLKQENSNQNQQQQKKQKKEEEQNEQSEHPYKGKSIDFFG
ncbi:hypothetical protein [Metabacillus malikii]|uniref:Skp family chaperone for outer membrane proteins n=1 Tax=Metabacillus malikii TaxID=1504265 RepID=A0ABT9ZG21_9BACI|nr:hypothetical protein [Metabacillus malikii]MDQ0230508.1 Skp family chaperone for outer membrane proteins [Metabacillus malikii]